MKPEITRSGMSAQERRLRSRAAKMLSGDGLLHGSIVVRKRRCGKPNCRCAKGEGHRALTLTARFEGRTEQIHIPNHLEATVRRWVQQDRELRGLIGELGHLHAEKIRKLKTQEAPSSSGS